MVKVAHGSKNAFNISNPGRYRCQVFHYHRRLSRLYLSVYQGPRTEPAFYLLFSDVAYIDAPMSWHGAGFDIADQDACIALMLDLGLIGEAIRRFPDAYAAITDYACLYTVQTPAKELRIIASSAAILKSIPAEIQ